MAARRRKVQEIDDATLAGVTFGPETAPKRGKSKSVAPVDAWEAVAAECPCRISAEEHKANRTRVHITTYKGPVMCVEGVAVEPNRWLPQPMPSGWRTTNAYRLAEL